MAVKRNRGGKYGLGEAGTPVDVTPNETGTLRKADKKELHTYSYYGRLKDGTPATAIIRQGYTITEIRKRLKIEGYITSGKGIRIVRTDLKK